MSNKNKQLRLNELDSIRGFACLIVVLFHYSMGRPWFDLGFSLGYAGVDLFFILSGFVIFMSIEKEKNPLRFLKKRFIRLYPLYWLSVSFAFLLIIIYTIDNNGGLDIELLTRYPVNLTMIQNIIGYRQLDGPYWTLEIEMTFYIFIAVILGLKLNRFLKPIFLVMIISFALLSLYTNHNSEFAYIYDKFKFLQFSSLFFAGIIFYDQYKNTFNILNIFLIIICFTCQIIQWDFNGNTQSYVTQL